MPRDRIRYRAWLRNWRANNPDSVYLSLVGWRERNPERARLIVRIGMQVTRAIKRGLLVRPDKCEWCGTVCKPEAAHKDYRIPLDVVWLCRPCHRQWDHDQPKSEIPA